MSSDTNTNVNTLLDLIPGINHGDCGELYVHSRYLVLDLSSIVYGSRMRKNLFLLSFLALAASNVRPLDLDYTISTGAGAAMALGGDLEALRDEFGSSVGDKTVYAPVLGAALRFGAEMAVSGNMHGTARLELRRLGYALWAPDVQASSWLALWAAGIQVGLFWEPDAWYAGFGASLSTPASRIAQASSQGGTGITVKYDVDAGRAIIPGVFMEAGLAFDRSFTAGQFEVTPRLGIEVGVWPFGIVDGVTTWQTSGLLVCTFKLERMGR